MPDHLCRIYLARKDYHQQKTPITIEPPDLHPGTLPSEKVTTQAGIGIVYSDEEWQRVVLV